MILASSVFFVNAFANALGFLACCLILLAIGVSLLMEELLWKTLTVGIITAGICYLVVQS